MKCKISKERLIDYFYDEFNSEDKTEFETHLAKCPSCQQELEQFSGTTNILRAWPDEEPNLNIKFVQEKSGLWDWLKPKISVRKFTIGFAVGLASILILLSLANFEADYSNGDFSMKMSLWPRAEQADETPAQPLALLVSRDEFNSWKRDSYQLIQNMVADVEARQRLDHRTFLTQFAQDIDRQRKQDLRFVGKGFEVYQLTNENRFRRTDQMLNQLLQASYVQNAQPQPLENKN